MSCEHHKTCIECPSPAWANQARRLEDEQRERAEKAETRVAELERRNDELALNAEQWANKAAESERRATRAWDDEERAGRENQTLQARVAKLEACLRKFKRDDEWTYGTGHTERSVETGKLLDERPGPSVGTEHVDSKCIASGSLSTSPDARPSEADGSLDEDATRAAVEAGCDVLLFKTDARTNDAPSARCYVCKVRAPDATMKIMAGVGPKCLDKAACERRRREGLEPIVWADEATPFTGAQVKALLEENERLRNEPRVDKATRDQENEWLARGFDRGFRKGALAAREVVRCVLEETALEDAKRALRNAGYRIDAIEVPAADSDYPRATWPKDASPQRVVTDLLSDLHADGTIKLATDGKGIVWLVEKLCAALDACTANPDGKS